MGGSRAASTPISTLTIFGITGPQTPTGSSRSSSKTVDLRLARKQSLKTGKDANARSSSVAALVLQTAPHVGSGPLSNAILKVSVSTTVEVRVRLEAKGISPEGGSDLPEVCKAGSSSQASYLPTSTAVLQGGQLQGKLHVEGFDPIPFALAFSRQHSTYVGSAGRRRCTVLRADRWDWRGNGEKPAEGRAADLEMAAGQLHLQLRECTASELRRCLQLQALQEAEQGEDYDTLHAQVSKAKVAGVELEHIERAEEKLKVWQKQGLHVHAGCEKEALREQMQWSKITRRNELPSTQEFCTACEDCPCNKPGSDCEVLDVAPNAVQELFGQDGDRQLFEELLGAALEVQEGSVWRSGGKFIFSAFNRNQSLVALIRMLENYGRKTCSKMLLDLATLSEKKYSGYVTAVQINFHPSGDSFHDQHRDIYSAKQRAGPNCTCSFRKCVGTVCYSLGSSRMCLLETMVDDFSPIRPCGDSCQGSRERRWLHSGEAMYFNAPWNQSHMHGIPMMGEDSGPRISVAFLLGAQALAI